MEGKVSFVTEHKNQSSSAGKSNEGLESQKKVKFVGTSFHHLLDGGSTSSLDHLFQHLTTITVKTLFLTFSLNFLTAVCECCLIYFPVHL